MFPFMGGLNGDDFGYSDDDYRHDEPKYSYDSGTTCKYCGKKGLWWDKTEAGFRLFDGLKEHNCTNRNLLIMNICNSMAR